jgi:hypothetical protein
VNPAAAGDKKASERFPVWSPDFKAVFVAIRCDLGRGKPIDHFLRRFARDQLDKDVVVLRRIVGAAGITRPRPSTPGVF